MLDALRQELESRGESVQTFQLRDFKKNPIPIAPFRWWRWFFMRLANKSWRRAAAGHHVEPEAMRAQPNAGRS